MARLELQNLCKYFGDVKAVDNIDLTVEDGEFLTFLGPSGCGKSTTLFAVAGLDEPTSGRILVDDTIFYDAKEKISVVPERRNCGLVFQSYALWPHMTVRGNLSFPLQIRKIPKSEQQKLIVDALELVEMESYIDRYPHELSGGQQQRIALARTLVYEPKLLLLDEPLSNLDAKLRNRARRWLKKLQKRLGLTTIYVTHDQSEALSLSDRIAVMNNGRFAQLDTPEEIYRNPADAFVADFIGASNFLDGTVIQSSEDEVIVDVKNGNTVTATTRKALAKGDAVRVSLRPEDIQFSNNSHDPVDGQNTLSTTIVGRDYLGSRFQYFLDVGGAEVRIETEDDRPSGDATISFSAGNCIAFPDDGASPDSLK